MILGPVVLWLFLWGLTCMFVGVFWLFLPETVQNLCGVVWINFVTAHGYGRWLHLLLEPGKSCCLIQTSHFGAVAAHLALQPADVMWPMGTNTLTWGFSAVFQQFATLDYYCLCLKPALALPHWDTTETECSWRCLERGLPGAQGCSRDVLVNPALMCHVCKLTAVAVGGSCVHFLCALKA